MTTFPIHGSNESLELRDPAVFVVGFSGRDPEAVRKHVDELAREGIAAPESVPHVWELDADHLTQHTIIPARPGTTSGEAEPVLLISGGDVFVAVGSDHTDRDLEKVSLQDAKAACKKVVSSNCWPLDSVRDRWDELVLESKARRRGAWVPYQEATLRELLPVDWFLERFGNNGEAVVFCGTVPTVNGMDTNATGFEAALTDPASGDRLLCSYRIEVGDG